MAKCTRAQSRDDVLRWLCRHFDLRGGFSFKGLLLSPDVIRRRAPVARPQPGGTGEGGKVSQGETQPFDGCEALDPEQPFHPYSDGLLGNTVTLGLARQGGWSGDLHDADLVMEIPRHIFGALVMARGETAR